MLDEAGKEEAAAFGEHITRSSMLGWDLGRTWKIAPLILKVKASGLPTFNAELSKHVYMWMWRQHVLQAGGWKAAAFLDKLSGIM